MPLDQTANQTNLVWGLGEVDVQELVVGVVARSESPDVVLGQAVLIAVDQHVTCHTCD